MVVVIDTNIVFSMLLAKGLQLRESLFDERREFYAPNFVMVEIFEKKEKLLKYSRLSETELYELMYRIFGRIKFVNEYAISRGSKTKAYELCKGIDEDDTPIIALAIELDGEVWTGDKVLVEGLKKKGFDRFFKISM